MKLVIALRLLGTSMLIFSAYLVWRYIDARAKATDPDVEPIFLVVYEHWMTVIPQYTLASGLAAAIFFIWAELRRKRLN